MSTTDRMKDAFFAIVRGALPLIDYYVFYRASVISQSGDGRLVDLKPDNPKLPGMQKVPLRLGLPGAVVKFTPGAKILVGWEDGDPRQPVAALFAGGEHALTISITADKIELGGTGLLPMLENVIIGKTPCQFTNAPHSAMGVFSKKVFAKE